MRIPSGSAHRPFRLTCLIAALLCCTAAGAAQEAAKDKTGVELVPPSPKEKPLHAWHLEDTKSKKRVATVNGRWGFEAVPPGEYELILNQYEANVPYETVKVSKDQITRIEVKAGVELVGRTAKEPPLYRWLLVDPKTKKAITNVDGRWGFTPVPPGEYDLHVQKYEAPLRYTTVKVGKDKPTRVEVKSGVEVLGRTAKEPPLYRWLIVDPKTKQTVTYADTRWGFTPVPPGEYELQIQKYEAPMTWSTIKVENNKSTRVDIKSGVEVVGNSPKEKPLYRWSLVDRQTKQVVTYANERWGFTPGPPGEYELGVQFYEEEIPFTTVRVAKDKIARVEVKSGVELVGRSSKEPPLDRWALLDVKTGKELVHVNNRWGFTPLPPGDYRLQIRPRNADAFAWGTVTVKPGAISKVRVASGVELLPKTENEKPPAHWYIYDIKHKGKKPVTDVRNRWGLALLGPGEYGITQHLGSFPTLRVKVNEDEIVKAQFPDLEKRFALVTAVGRQTEKQRDPEGYKKLEEEVERAIRRAALWLKKQRPIAPKLDLNDEYGTLGVLALLHAGEFERDPALAEECLDYLLRRQLNDSYGTYATALTSMALSDWDAFSNARRIHECAQWLVENQGWTAKDKVWGYGDRVPGIGDLKKERITIVTPPAAGDLEVTRRGLVQRRRDYWDNSCSQFAVLGLHAAAHAGIKLPRETWTRVQDHFREVHSSDDGGWGYHKGSSTGSMTCAGVASMLLARHHLGEKKPALDPAIIEGLEWLAGHFNLDRNPYSNTDHYYSLYGLERVGVLAGTEFLGDHEWYPEGARYLLKNQKSDGSWQSKTGPPAGSYDVYQDTCYAILFLRRATLPTVPPKPGILEVVYKQPKLPPAIVPNIELVLDCSGSMDDKIKGNESRMVAARRVMDQLISEIPDHFNVGFRVFGHQGFWDWRRLKQAPDDHPGWYTDTELLVPIGPLGQGRPAMRKWINYMEPAGATPLVYALLQARKDFHDSMKGPKAVILISDGLENCKGKMEDVEKAYRGSGIDVVIHVVGFAIKEKEHKVLELLAKWTKGNYYRADDASQLAKALKDAMGSLNFIVQNDGGRVVAQGALNGPGVMLKAGSYRVSIQGIREAPLQVQVQSDQRLRLTLDDAGKLIVAGGSDPRK